MDKAVYEALKRFVNYLFQIITNSSSLLTTLVVSNCKWLTDDLLKPVFETNPFLKHVDLSGCQNITTISMQILAIRLI